MIYSISGKLINKEEGIVIIEVNGISYEIFVPITVFRELDNIGDNITLYTKLIIKENEIFVVGFLKYEDKKLFETLITVTGIGAKQALKIMSELTTSEIRNAIIQEDEMRLASIKGIGAKTASRIILELKDKIRKLQIEEITPLSNNFEKKKMEILMAMRVLGYNDYESKKIIDQTFANNPQLKEKQVEDIIKIILSRMAK